MKLREQLIRKAENYSDVAGISLGRLSTLLRNDGKFLDRIKNGASCTLETYEHCMSWMDANPPEEHVKGARRVADATAE